MNEKTHNLILEAMRAMRSEMRTMADSTGIIRAETAALPPLKSTIMWT